STTTPTSGRVPACAAAWWGATPTSSRAAGSRTGWWSATTPISARAPSCNLMSRYIRTRRWSPARSSPSRSSGRGAAPARCSTSRLGASGGIYVRTSQQDSQSIELVVFGEDGSDLDEGARRRVERGYYREEFRRAFGREMGELRYPPRAIEHYAVALVHSL